MLVGNDSIHRGSKLNKMVEVARICSLLELKHPSSPTLRPWYSWFSGFQSQTGTCTTGSPDTSGLQVWTKITLVFLGLQLMDNRPRDYSSSVTT